MFELGKFYSHIAGRKIAIVGTVNTTRWGTQFVIEEADKTGHGTSCMDTDAEKNENWMEIGEAEWLTNFEEGKDEQKNH